LEFQIESSQLAHHSSSRTNNNNTNNSEIQLWDCSADRK
jgi:hypothetical protein